MVLSSANTRISDFFFVALNSNMMRIFFLREHLCVWSSEPNNVGLQWKEKEKNAIIDTHLRKLDCTLSELRIYLFPFWEDVRRLECSMYSQVEHRINGESWTTKNGCWNPASNIWPKNDDGRPAIERYFGRAANFRALYTDIDFKNREYWVLQQNYSSITH